MANDDTYLQGLPATIGAPFLLRSYWYANYPAGTGTWVFNNTDGAITAWQNGETENGGS
jgi:hypothetical protein